LRDGGAHVFLLGLGALCLLGGAWTIFWLLSGGELTVAGALFLFLIPGGAMLFGVHALNIALWLRHEYLLGGLLFAARTYSLFGNKQQEIARAEIVGIRQDYTPPDNSSPTGAKGEWTTFVVYREAAGKRERALPLEGAHSEAEARWLGPLLANWAKVQLRRGHGAGFEEADPSELPRL
jgi:hypothetical protein